MGRLELSVFCINPIVPDCAACTGLAAMVAAVVVVAADGW